MENLKCIIVDDNEIDRLTIVSFAKRFPQLQIIAVCQDAASALEILEKNEVDLLFLDIDMPEISGVELRKKAANVPACVFITSHPEFAVESFELDTLDFIVKPLKFDRFEQCMNRINEFFEIRRKAHLFESSIGGDVIYIKEGHQQIKIKLHEIHYLEALKDYTLLITSQKRHCVLSNLGQLLRNKSFNSFIRIHKSFAVQKQFINQINAQQIILNNNAVLPIGRSFKANLQSIL